MRKTVFLLGLLVGVWTSAQSQVSYERVAGAAR